jgi:hypothetical protein
MALLECRVAFMSVFLILSPTTDTWMAPGNTGYHQCMLTACGGSLAPIQWEGLLSKVLSMSCSTLDPVLRMERQGVTPQGLALILAIIAYLFAKPGVLATLPFNADI